MNREGLTLDGQDARSSNDGLDRLLNDLHDFPDDEGIPQAELMVGVAGECSVGRQNLGGAQVVRVDGLIVGVLGMGGRPDVRDVRLLLDGLDGSVAPCEIAEALDGAAFEEGDEAAFAEGLARVAVRHLGVRGAIAVIGIGDGLLAGSAGSLERFAGLALQALGGQRVRIVWEQASAAVA